MKVWKTLGCIALSLCLCAMTLSGCTLGSDNLEEDTIYQATGYASDTVVMRINGKDITAEVYCYWLSNSINYLDQEVYGGEGVEWSDTQDGLTTAEYVKLDAVDTVVLYQVVEEKAEEYNVTLTQENQAELDALRDKYISLMGGDEASYLKELQLFGVSEETFLHFPEVGYLYENLFAALYGEGGALSPSEAELTEFVEDYVTDQGYESLEAFLLETGYIYVKQIYIAKVNEHGVQLTEEEIQEKKQLADGLLTQLQESGEPLTLFDQLMAEHSEDPELALYPDGYVLDGGDSGLAAEFEAASYELEVNEISQVVESEEGYHIILRRPDLDMFLSIWGGEQFVLQMQTWMEEAQIEHLDAYDKIDPQSYYEKMQELYDAGHAEASPSPDVSPSPEQSPDGEGTEGNEAGGEESQAPSEVG